MAEKANILFPQCSDGHACAVPKLQWCDRDPGCFLSSFNRCRLHILGIQDWHHFGVCTTSAATSPLRWPAGQVGGQLHLYDWDGDTTAITIHAILHLQGCSIRLQAYTYIIYYMIYCVRLIPDCVRYLDVPLGQFAL